MEIVKDLKINVDINRIRDDLSYILTQTDWSDNQIALQYAAQEDWHSGNGKSDLLAADEQQFVNWHSTLNGRYILELVANLPFPVSHARLMRLPPKTCYTTHVDYYTRYHIPIITKPLQTFMVFPDENPSIIRMYPGNIYWTNTHQLHNFVNGTFVERIHLVFNNALETKYVDNPYLKM